MGFCFAVVPLRPRVSGRRALQTREAPARPPSASGAIGAGVCAALALCFVASAAADVGGGVTADGIKGAVHDCVQQHQTSGTQRVACILDRWEESLRRAGAAQPARLGMTREGIRAFVEACDEEHVLHTDDLETCVAARWRDMLAAASGAAPTAPSTAPRPNAPAAGEHLSTPLRVISTPRQLTLQLKNVDSGQEGLGVRGNVKVRATASGYQAYSGGLFVPSSATTLTIELCPETATSASVADHWEVTAVKPRLEYNLAGKSSPHVACHEPGCEQPLGARLESEMAAIADAACKAWDADAIRVKGSTTTPGLEAVPSCAGTRQDPECWLDFRARAVPRRCAAPLGARRRPESRAVRMPGRRAPETRRVVTGIPIRPESVTGADARPPAPPPWPVLATHVRIHARRAPGHLHDRLTTPALAAFCLSGSSDMTALSPQRAAEIAKGVYALRQEANLRTAFELGTGLGLANLFAIDGAARLAGPAGIGGFGLIAHGIGARHGELLIALRGSAAMRDLMTDIRGNLQSGPGGHLVHAGFNETFKSLHEQIRGAIAGAQPAAVHCVGHSLGGALATLAAESLAHEGAGAVYLYTFGSPRVGLGPFSADLTRALGEDHIHRVYHDADPISMIPLFPYAHVPNRGRNMRLAWNGGRVAPAAHLMDNYIASIAAAGWGGLSQPAAGSLDDDVRAWLDSAAPRSPLLSASTFWAITDALGWIIRHIHSCVVGTVFVVGATLLDRLAWILWQGALASRAVAADATVLMRRILQFLGRGAQSPVNLSVAFVRWVLDLLFSAVTSAAALALSVVDGH